MTIVGKCLFLNSKVVINCPISRFCIVFARDFFQENCFRKNSLESCKVYLDIALFLSSQNEISIYKKVYLSYLQPQRKKKQISNFSLPFFFIRFLPFSLEVCKRGWVFIGKGRTFIVTRIQLAADTRGIYYG